MVEMLSRKNGEIILKQVITYKGDQYQSVKLFDQNGKITMQLP